ncbi:glycosyltransferase family 2 protein [Dietzia maris]
MTTDTPDSDRRTFESGPSITVVICAYTRNRWDDVLTAIYSVSVQESRALETLVVIDHNDDLLHDLRTEVARRSWPDVRVIPSTGARGLSGARNTGVSAARGDVVAFLDDDATASPDWCSIISRHMSNSSVLGLGGHAEPVWPTTRPGWFPAEFLWVVGCSYPGQPREVAPVRNPIGCNMALRTSDVLEVGGFSDGIGRIGTTPLGCEETELSIRLGLLRPSGRILYDPSLRVSHRVTEERTTWAYFARRCRAEGMSKAIVSRMVGAQSALSAERRYTTRVLPVGVARRVATAAGWGHTESRRGELAQAGAILAGFAMTAGGYARAVIATAAGRVS